MSARFDPAPGTPYAQCEGCDTSLATRDEMREHFAATMTNGKSHRARITNQSRAERIVSELDNLADEALYDFVNAARELVDDGDATEEEITEAVRNVVADFADAWAEEVK